MTEAVKLAPISYLQQCVYFSELGQETRFEKLSRFVEAISPSSRLVSFGNTRHPTPFGLGGNHAEQTITEKKRC